jgi:hypothetical protein
LAVPTAATKAAAAAAAAACTECSIQLNDIKVDAESTGIQITQHTPLIKRRTREAK